MTSTTPPQRPDRPRSRAASLDSPDVKFAPHQENYQIEVQTETSSSRKRASSLPAEDFINKKSLTTDNEVRSWLTNEGFRQYIENFEAANLTSEEVPFLTDTHLKQIGILKVGHRIRLLKAIKNFKRALSNIKRNEAIVEFQNWYWRPSACVFFPKRYQITPAAIIVYNPKPLQCGYSVDRIDMSQVVDVNLIEFCFLGYLTVLSTDKFLPRVKIRLLLEEARKAFMILKSLWEEEQALVGNRALRNV